MKSFIDNAKLKNVAIRLEEMLSPEDKGKMKGLSQDLTQKKIHEVSPDYDPNAAVPSSFKINEADVDNTAPMVLKALIKYRAIRTMIGKFEFEVRKDDHWTLHDKLVKPIGVDPTEYYQKNFMDKIPASLDGVRQMLYKQVDFATNMGHRKARVKELLKQAMLSDVSLDETEETLDKTAFTESVGTRTLRQSISVASQALKKLKMQFKAGDLRDMSNTFDTAIHALSMGKSVASVRFEADPERKPRIKKTTSPMDNAVKDKGLPLS